MISQGSDVPADIALPGAELSDPGIPHLPASADDPSSSGSCHNDSKQHIRPSSLQRDPQAGDACCLLL
jgi:hypothetical protein